MKFVTLLPLFFISFFASHAQHGRIAITGTIRDAVTSEALIGVHVLINTAQRGTTTDQYGRFAFVAPTGRLEIQCSYVGFEGKRLAFTAHEDTSLALFLTPEAVELNAIQISGSNSPSSHIG